MYYIVYHVFRLFLCPNMLYCVIFCPFVIENNRKSTILLCIVKLKGCGLCKSSFFFFKFFFSKSLISSHDTLMIHDTWYRWKIWDKMLYPVKNIARLLLKHIVEYSTATLTGKNRINKIQFFLCWPQDKKFIISFRRWWKFNLVYQIFGP